MRHLIYHLIWDKAENFIVSDPWGNRWVDWSSCVLVANIGHGHDAIKTGLKKQIDKDFIAAYVFIVRTLYIAA